MPAYDYQCDACNVTYELRQGFDAESSHTCEQCGKGRARRVLTAPLVVFKGSGWYATDSRKGSSSKGSESGGETGSKTADAPESTPAAAKAGDASTAASTPSSPKSSGSSESAAAS